MRPRRWATPPGTCSTSTPTTATTPTTARATVSLANLRIVCPVKNPQQGYELTGAGTVDLLTVSAADVTIEGLRFTRTAGAGPTTAGLLTTAGAARLGGRP